MKRCGYCGTLIEGEPLEITPASEAGARPTVYWCREQKPCQARQRAAARSGSSAIRRYLIPS
ncbi:hypothetical protein [Streptomyces sp. NPDC088757]|uniref:hypothetical protein n=1 Tax=Streptomyces sp. NPDC088757 TaxID=3365889 RepID=UPI003804EB3A